MKKRTAVTIQGIVIAATWNRVGEITAVDIAGYDEKRYRIADDHMGRQLQVLNKKRIVVHGFLDIDNNKPVLYVHHYIIDTSNAIKASKSQGG